MKYTQPSRHHLTTRYHRRQWPVVAAIFAFSGLSAGNAAAAPQLAVDVSASNTHSCLVTSCGDVHCWGNNNDGQAADRIFSDKLFVPIWEGLYDEVTTGYAHTCARQRATPPGQGGRVTCWGNNDHGQLNVPTKSVFQPYLFKQIDAGRFHTCGITVDDEVKCWGHNGDNRSNAPVGAFRHVAAGNTHSCAVRADTTEVLCWGNNGSGQTHGGSVSDAVLPFATEGFVSVSAGLYHTCAVSDARRLVCWGSGTYGQRDGQALFGATNGTLPTDVLDPTHFVTPAGSDVRVTNLRGYRQVDAGSWGSCVVHRSTTSSDPNDNRMMCMGWQMGPGGNYVAPADTVQKLSFGNNHGCYIDGNDEVQCWGYQWQGAHLPPQLAEECPVPRGFTPQFY